MISIQEKHFQFKIFRKLKILEENELDDGRFKKKKTQVELNNYYNHRKVKFFTETEMDEVKIHQARSFGKHYVEIFQNFESVLQLLKISIK